MPSVLQSRRLSNGIRVDLVVSRDPRTAEAAVCSCDESGGTGPLNSLVLHAAGLPPEALLDGFKPPACLLRGGSFPVLAVATNRSSWPEDAGIRANLGRGLDLLAELPPLATLWIPLVGTGSAELPFEQSASVIVDALSRSSNRNGTRRILLAAPTEDAAARVVQHRSFELTTIAVVTTQLEPHVNAALAAAYTFAQGLIDAGSVLRAVLVLARPDATLESNANFASNAGFANNPGFANNAGFESNADGFEKQAFDAFADLLPRRGAMLEDLIKTHGHFEDRGTRPVRFHAFRAFANAFADATRRFPDRLWGRHLITAALLSSDPAPLEAFAREAGTTLPVLRRRWYEWLTTDEHHPIEMWDHWWREAGLPPPHGLHAGYQPDAVRGDDQLGLESHVEAFARLITDSKVELPLSIGLLGDWGSGKSFFLDLLEKRIEGLEGSAGHSGNVVQIRFNAWTFSDANLWAGLVEQILQRVWKELLPPEKSTLERREELQRAIAAANGALHEANAQVGLAQVALQQAEANVKERLQLLAVSNMLRDDGSKLWSETLKLAKALGWDWDKDVTTIVEVSEARQQLTRSAERLRHVVHTALKEGPGWRWLAIGLGAVAVLSFKPLLEAMPQVAAALAPTGKVLAWIAGLAGPLLAPLRRAHKTVEALADKLDETKKGYEQALQVAKNSADPTTKELGAQAERSRSELVSAQASLESAQRRLADLLSQEAAQDPMRRLSSYLQERVGDYRTKQGIISLVRRDFEKLAQLMSDWREDTRKAPDGVRPVDRIVLYVDDLDRCSPALVVQALEAVHLLLALDLFVVVVAVDSRWLLRSLEVHYHQLLGKDSATTDGLAASPQHYLEKIFQITFALAPMSEEGYERYIDHLTASDAQAPAPATTATAAPRAPLPGSTTPEDFQAGAAALVQVLSAPPEPEPPRLSIQAHETELIKQMQSLVPSPRTAKRLVNVFRLFKASLSPRVADDFEAKDTGAYRPTLVLLTLLFGRPALARALFASLCTATPPFNGRGDDFREAVESWTVTPGLEADVAELLSILTGLEPPLTVGECIPVARELARYSLITGPSWHTWTRSRHTPATPPTDGRHAPTPAPVMSSNGA